MASKPLQNPPSPSASTLFLPLGRLSRRGSLASLSSPTQLDRESLAQALDQIHNSASQSESLTTFNEFASPPSSSSVPEGKSLAGELVQSGLSGLYSRFREVVGGVRDIVEDAMGSGIDASTDASTTKSGEGVLDASTSAQSSPVAVSTPSESRLQSPVTTMFSSTATINQTQSQKASGNSSKTSIAPSKVSTSSSTTNGVKAPLPPFSRMTTSAAANPALVPVTVNAFKDSDGHTVDGPNTSARADIFVKEPFSSSGQAKEKELPRKSEPRTTIADPSDPRKLPSTVSNLSTFTEAIGEVPGLVTPQMSDSEDSDAIVSGDEEDGVNVDGMVFLRDADSYGEDNVKRQGETNSGGLDGSREMPNKSFITGNNASTSQQFATSTQNPTCSTSLAPTSQSSTARPKDTTNDQPSSKVSGPPQKAKQPLPDGVLAATVSALKLQPAISRISESHLPGLKLSRSLSTDTTESSIADTIASNDIQETRGTADGEPTRADKGTRRQLNGNRNEGDTEAVNTVLKQLRSGVLSKEFWMKDENCKECFLCGDSFSAWRRKHHCRQCGPIIFRPRI
jgi:1-phosphatidylinositol-3-phosphate 5-kinase